MHRLADDVRQVSRQCQISSQKCSTIGEDWWHYRWVTGGENLVNRAECKAQGELGSGSWRYCVHHFSLCQRDTALGYCKSAYMELPPEQPSRSSIGAQAFKCKHDDNLTEGHNFARQSPDQCGAGANCSGCVRRRFSQLDPEKCAHERNAINSSQRGAHFTDSESVFCNP